jgi:hypothetical protein
MGGYIKANLKETECGRVVWIHLAQGSVQWGGPENTVINLWLP